MEQNELSSDAVQGLTKEQQDLDKKCVVFGLSRWMDRRKFEKLLQSIELSYEKAKKLPNFDWGVITFLDKKQRDDAMEFLRKHSKGNEVGNKPIFDSVEEKTPKGDSMRKKKKRMNEENAQNNHEQSKKPKLSDYVEDEFPIGSENQTVQDVTSPLWKVPYEEQLKLKAANCHQALVDITKLLKKEGKNSPTWAIALGYRDPCCTFDGIKGMSPDQIEGYRNKVQFTIGRDAQHNPSIGFMLAKTQDQSVVVIGDPNESKIVSTHAKNIRNVFQTYITQHAVIKDIYDKHVQKGFWRQLEVRTYKTGEAMAVFQVKPIDYEELIDQEIENLCNFCKHAIQKGELQLHSLMMQKYSGVSNSAPFDCPIDLLLGEPYIHEILVDLKFRISPKAFFQVNTIAADTLYRLIGEWSGVNSESTVIDVCCGTGTIGLTMARKVKRVYGVELSEAAVIDARQNAKLNDITNAEFINGKAEEVLPKLLYSHKYSKLPYVAIIDPPRAGLHPKTVQSLRSCTAIQRLVYVSCDKKGLLGNVAGLCRTQSKQYKGQPFVPIKAVSVDMFPMTEHVELVVLFERKPLETKKPIEAQPEVQSVQENT